MKKTLMALATAALVTTISGPVMAEGKTIGVSWKVFQEERWKRDEAVIKKIVEDVGNTYISADAQGSGGKQLTDVESLIYQGADVLMIVPFDSEAILPVVEQASAEGIPMIADDVHIDDPDSLYITFDNVDVPEQLELSGCIGAYINGVCVGVSWDGLPYDPMSDIGATPCLNAQCDPYRDFYLETDITREAGEKCGSCGGVDDGQGHCGCS